MKSLTGKFTSVRGWALLLALLLGAGLIISACGDEEVPTPTTPAPTPAPTPTPTTPTPTPTPTPEPTGPATPENLRVSGTTSDSITWTWDAVEGVLAYQGQFSTDTTFTDIGQTALIDAPMRSHTVSGLQGNTTGNFRVRSGAGTSVTNLQYSDWSDAVTGTTSAPPPAVPLSAPGNFRSTAEGDNSITLSWSAVDDADTYEVGQREGSGSWGSASCGGNDNEVDDTECVASGLDEATEYDFRVRAVPDSDDDTLATSSWTELASVVSTTGTPPPTTVSGGENDLNMIWETDDNEITWIWDQVADRDRAYQTYLPNKTALPDIDSESPCPKPAESGMWGDPDNAGATFTTRASTYDGAAGDVRLLCVQTTWMDDRDVRQYGNLSWSWAAAPPTAPAAGSPDDNEKTRKTDQITWSVDLDAGFTYAFSLVSTAAEMTPDPAEVPTQEACDAGKSLPDETTDIGITLTEYEVGGLTYYQNYQLCYRAERDSSESAWATSAAAGVYTLPAQPSTPRAADATLTDTQTALSWTIASKAGTPRKSAGYTVKVIRDAQQEMATTAKLENCELGDNEFDDAGNASLTDTQDGIKVDHTVAVNGLETHTRHYYLCVQADLTGVSPQPDNPASRVSKWALGGKTTQAKKPAPSN